MKLPLQSERVKEITLLLFLLHLMGFYCFFNFFFFLRLQRTLTPCFQAFHINSECWKPSFKDIDN